MKHTPESLTPWCLQAYETLAAAVGLTVES